MKKRPYFLGFVGLTVASACFAPQTVTAGEEPPKRGIVVRVSDRDGKPLPGVAIRAEGVGSPSDDRYARPAPPVWVRDAVTDVSGTAAVDTGAGEFQVRARLAGYATAVAEDRGRGGEIAIELVPAARIEGRVIDSGTEKPRPGVRVECLPSLRRWWEFRGLGSFGDCSTDAEGRFVIDTAPPGKLVVLRVDEPGFGRAHVDVRTRASGSVASVDVVLGAPVKLRGVVRDEAGKVRSEARVWAIAREPSLVRAEIADWPWRCLGISDVDAEATTGADGSFLLAGLASSSEYVLFAVWNRPPQDNQSRVLCALLEGVGAAADAPLEIRLTPYPRALVRLVDEKGAPLKDLPAVTYIDNHGQYNTRSDADGWAEVAPEIGGLRRGKVRVRVMVQNRGQAEVDVDMSDGKDARVEVVLR